MHDTGNLYADLSGYYDQFCSDVNYQEQCEFSLRAFDCFGASGGRDYLDLACGTGQHLRHMADFGFTPTGLDYNQAMLDQAALRCPEAQLVCCDMAALDQLEAFDLITCFLYSIHYSHPTTAVAETLWRAHRALKPGGLMIFDAVDKRGITPHNDVISQAEDGSARLSFQSGWRYRGEGEVLDLELCITREDASGTRCWRDHHTMTAITLPEMRDLLEGAGFEVTLLEHDYGSMRAWDGASFNAIVAAFKPAKI